MKTITPILFLGLILTTAAEAKPVECKKKVGNLCYRISGFARSRIDANPTFQRALEAMAEKLKATGDVYIIQGARSAQEQAALRRQHCGNARRCFGYAKPSNSRHVIAIAADPWVSGQNIKSLCQAENQARVEFLGPRSAAGVYGASKVKFFDGTMRMVTGGHIDASTGSNYTPKCKRNEGLGPGQVVRATPANDKQTVDEDTGARKSKKVTEYKQKRVAKRQQKASKQTAQKKTLWQSLFGDTKVNTNWKFGRKYSRGT